MLKNFKSMSFMALFIAFSSSYAGKTEVTIGVKETENAVPLMPKDSKSSRLSDFTRLTASTALAAAGYWATKVCVGLSKNALKKIAYLPKHLNRNLGFSDLPRMGNSLFTAGLCAVGAIKSIQFFFTAGQEVNKNIDEIVNKYWKKLS